MTASNQSRYAPQATVDLIPVPFEPGSLESFAKRLADYLNGDFFAASELKADWYRFQAGPDFDLSIERAAGLRLLTMEACLPTRILKVCQPAKQEPGHGLNLIPEMNDVADLGIRKCRGCDALIESDTYCKRCLEEIESLIAARPFVMPNFVKNFFVGVGYGIVFALAAVVLIWIMLVWPDGAR